MDAQNWASDALPTAASDVQIDVPSRDIQVRIAGLAQAATVDCLESLRLIGSGSLTTSTLTELNIYVAGDLTIDSGGSINGYGLGYGPSTGPGGGATQYVGGGAGHGGSGGRGYDRLNHRYLNGGPAYGSPIEPTSFGSGGGSTLNQGSGGAGGGAIRLEVGGLLTVDGSISADGKDAGSAAGGGSGGSIYITTGSFSGNGTISANGGDMGSSGQGEGGGGGGGRIALYYDDSNFTGLVEAHGGIGYENGGAGTVAVNPMSLGGSLYYRDADGDDKPASHIWVEVREKQAFIADDYTIAEGFTDANGYFRFTQDVDGNPILNEDPGLLESETRDIYFVFWTENEAAFVKENTIAIVSHSFETDTDYDVTDRDYYRTWHATSTHHTADHAAVLGIPGQMERSRLWFQEATAWSRSQITVVYPSWLPTSELFNLIFLREDYGEDRVEDSALFTAAHEYGHTVHSAAYNGLPGFTEKDHTYNTETDEWTAIVEGWAEFFSSGVTGETWIDNLGDVEGEYWGDIAGVPFWWGREVGEVDAWRNENGKTGEIVEGAVAATFWDLYDGPDMYLNGDDDGINGRLLDVWAVFSEDDPTSMWNDDGDETDDFYHCWNARYGQSRMIDEVFIDHGMPVWDDSYDSLGGGNDLRGSATLLADTTQTYTGLVCIDPDWYRFTTNNVSSDASEIKIEFDPRRGIPDLAIFDAGGNAIAENTEFLGYSQGFKTLGFAAMPGGTYYVRVVGHGDVEATFDLYEGDMSPEYTLTLNVSAAPVANDDAFSVAEDSLDNHLNVLANDSDPDIGDILEVISVTQPSHGTTSFTASGAKYTPEADYYGTDGFFYVITDGHGTTDTAWVGITILNENDDPVARDDTFAILAGAPSSRVDVLANDSHEPDPTEVLTVTSAGPASNGTVNVLGGEVFYRPADGFTGQDGFSYTITDGHGGSDTGVVMLDVFVNAAELDYSQDFAGGMPSADEGWLCMSSSEGRIAITDGGLRMDDQVDGGEYSLNEATLYLALEGHSKVFLECDSTESSDEVHLDGLAVGDSFAGQRNADIIAASTDNGTTWTVVHLLETSGHVTVALHELVDLASAQQLQFKFQQYDNYAWPTDGWAFDNIEVYSDMAEVVDRHIFYNRSYFDGNDASANTNDDNAIDTSKQALLPGETATFANYTSYSRGINGIMVDIVDMSGTPTDADFGIRVNEAADPDTWSTGPIPTVSVRPGEGVGGSDRVTLIWADGAILNQWVEVTVLSDTNGGGLGLAADDVFYFANVVGDCDGDGEVGSSDYGTFIGEFGLSGDGLATDFNVDRRVDLHDFVTMRSRFGETIPTPTFPDPAPQAFAEPIVQTATLMPPITSPPPDAINAIDASDGAAVVMASAPAVDLLAESLSPGEYIPETPAISAGSSQLAATAEYDLRPLSDDLDAGDADELLADILAESLLTVPL